MRRNSSKSEMVRFVNEECHAVFKRDDGSLGVIFGDSLGMTFTPTENDRLRKAISEKLITKQILETRREALELRDSIYRT